MKTYKTKTVIINGTPITLERLKESTELVFWGHRGSLSFEFYDWAEGTDKEVVQWGKQMDALMQLIQEAKEHVCGPE